MSDLISRQAAIDSLNSLQKFSLIDSNEYLHGVVVRLKFAVQQLEQLPSAEPEIIRCKDCKFWTHIKRTNRSWCKTDDGLYNLNPSPDDFCSRAERRTDERA